MSLFKTSGVIIKSADYKENDKLLWIYTEELGKITAIAKGAKKNKSRLFSVTSPLCYSDYVVFKGKNLFNLQEGKIINSFKGLMSNLDKLTYASYVCELIDIGLEDGEIDKNLYIEFIKTLYLLNTDAIDYELLIRSFELKLLKATGYGINLETCSICKRKIRTSKYINLQSYGGICENCNKDHSIHISKEAYAALKFLNKIDASRIYMMKLSGDIKKQIEKINLYFISTNYSRKPKSLEMLNYIKE
ncbi:DNA repair protein RecO [Clostridium thermobutyricum]|uniref:DNA repair protein RecO n=1 Tax=Clostridium thermobutyricum TaxID=29372 RepID=N9Y228_9CLOT|nr:DNA repair protein RecO [Clostridium thermobutyricum]ENZ02194.1 DNA repair protein RecO [Clostridium thermobutyricum]